MTHYPPPFYFSLLVHFIREQIKKGACSGRFAWTLTAPSARGFAPSFLSPFERTQQSSSFPKGTSFPGRREPSHVPFNKTRSVASRFRGNDNLHKTSSFLKGTSFPKATSFPKGSSFPRKREATPLLPYQIILLVLFVGFEVSAGQRPPLPPPSSGDPKGNTSTPSSPPVKREKQKVLNIGNVIQGRLPEGSKDNPSTPSDNIPASPGVVVQGTLRINVDSFKDFKICDKQGKCHQVCFKDGTGCPSCRAPCAELCARRATKLCEFGSIPKYNSPLKWDAFASTEVAQRPDLIKQARKNCSSDAQATQYCRLFRSGQSRAGVFGAIVSMMGDQFPRFMDQLNKVCASDEEAVKLCRFSGGNTIDSSDAFASTEEARFPEFIEQLKRICFKDGDPNQKAPGTWDNAFHYTCHSHKKGCRRGAVGSGGHDHDRPFWGFVPCMDELIAAGRCPAYSCKRCRDCVNKIGYGENHNRISNWKGGGRNGLYLCNDECGGVWERVIPTNYHAKHGSGNTDWKARLQKCGRVDECPLLPD